MNFEKARISLEYLYNHVTKDTAELRKLLKIPKATFYLNLNMLHTWNNQPNRVRSRESMKMAEKGLSITKMKN